MWVLVAMAVEAGYEVVGILERSHKRGEVSGFESLIVVGKLFHRQQRGNSLIPLSINSLCLDACGRSEIVADEAREGRERVA